MEQKITKPFCYEFCNKFKNVNYTIVTKKTSLDLYGPCVLTQAVHGFLGLALSKKKQLVVLMADTKFMQYFMIKSIKIVLFNISLNIYKIVSH